MQITFFRKGHANNSSSSHSLIFATDENKFPNTEDEEFGWDFFTCSSLQAKKNYILCCLRDAFRLSTDIKSSYNADISYDIVDKFQKDFFCSWINKHFSEFEFDLDCLDNAYVDHQSVFLFPLYRDKQKGINKKLAKDVIREFLNRNYVVLGGNDNTNETHPLRDEGDENLQFITFWNFCVDKNPLCMAEYDELTGEYVISQPSRHGSLMKIKI